MSAIASQKRYESRTRKLQVYGRASERIGRQILLCLWGIYARNLHIMGNYESFDAYVEGELKESFASGSEYLKDLGFVTTRVFSYVQEHINDNDPILSPDGKPITVPGLIRTKNWLGKLVVISQWIERVPDNDEERNKLFDSAFKMSRDELAAHLRAANNDRTPIRIERLIRQTPDGCYEVIFRNVDGDGLKLLHKQTDAFSEDVIR